MTKREELMQIIRSISDKTSLIDVMSALDDMILVLRSEFKPKDEIKPLLQAVEDVTANQYASALSRMNQYLLNHKTSEDLNQFEIQVICSIIKLIQSDVNLESLMLSKRVRIKGKEHFDQAFSQSVEHNYLFKERVYQLFLNQEGYISSIGRKHRNVDGEWFVANDYLIRINGTDEVGAFYRDDFDIID